MPRLLCLTIASLDLYMEDESGRFDWAMPDEEVHTFVNDLMRGVDTYLYGRRMYETMVSWETLDAAGEPPCVADFARIWRAANKVVYSRTLDAVRSERTRLEREWDADAVRRLKQEARGDLAIGGPGLAREAIRAGLVDEYHLLLVPSVVGRGKPALPVDDRLDLQLIEERRFGNGTVYLRYGNRA